MESSFSNNILQCPALSYSILVTCSEGYFKNLETDRCEKCPKGEYQPSLGQTKCLKCPAGSVIVGNDTKDYTSCRSK